MKKTFATIRKVSTTVLLIFVLVIVMFTLISTFVVGNQEKHIFGYRMFAVQSDSMQDTFRAGDIVMVKSVDCSTLKPGDIITFKSTNPSSYGKIVTHKIRELTITEKNEPAFITYGTATDDNDDKPVVYGKVIGKYQFKMAGAGKFFQFLKSPPGYVIFILLPFATLAALQVVKSVSLYKKLRIQLADEGEEQAKADDRTAQLEEEIRRLKEQIEKPPQDDSTSP